jgi:iron complex outermembrane receptor protein
MKAFFNARSRDRSAHISAASTGTLTATAGAVLVLFAAVAQAQQAPAGETQTVTVTGIRKGIEDAISIKKNADSIVEAISAEDIGKLPDASVAEAISRLPGLATQRNKLSGQAQTISIRGLAPDFATGTLNGREQASTSDSRSVDFDQFPAELLGGVTVYKSPDSQQLNQGLAGTIDMRSVRPLDFGKRAIAVNLRNEKSGIGIAGAGEGKGTRGSLSYIDQFADRKLGVALGFTRLDEKGAAQLKFNGWDGGEMRPYNGASVKVPGAFTADTETQTNKRDGAMAVIQYKPSKDFETTFDYFYTKGDFKDAAHGLEGCISCEYFNYQPAGVLSNAVIANGVATSGTYSNYKGVIRNHVNTTADQLDSLGLNSKLKLADWSTMLDLSESKDKRHNSRYETTAGQPGDYKNGLGTGGVPLGSISWTGYNGSNIGDVKFTPSVNYTDRNIVKLTDINGWSGGASSPQAGYISLPTVIDTIDAFRLSGKHALDFGPFQEIELGANYTKRTKTHSADEGRLVLIGNDPYAGVTMPGSETSVAGTTGISVASWDPTGSLGSIYSRADKVDTNIRNKTWGVEEKVTTAYARGSIDTKLAGMDLRGNLGLQLVQTDQRGTGQFVNSTTCTGNTPATCPATDIAAGVSYNDVLPSLNLAWSVANDSLLRFGLGRSMSRPSMADMRASASWSLNLTSTGGPRYEGSSGNPFLKPYRANVVDVSFEKYFGKKGYVSGALFYKDLVSYVYQQTTALPLSSYGVTVPSGVNPIAFFTAPANGTGGTLQGLELSVSLPFGMFVNALDGFGAQLNYAYTDSSVNIPTSAVSTTGDTNVSKLPLPGMSKNTSNLRIYYEGHGLQVAVAYRERSNFLGEITDFQDNRQLTFVKGEKSLDLQMSYDIPFGPLKGLSVLFQGSNLTKTAFQRYRGDTGEVVEKIPTGKRYLIGVNYKL